MTALDEPTTAPATPPERPSWSRRRRTVVAVVAVVALLAVALGGYALWARWRLDQALASVHTEQVFSAIDPATRPAPSADGGTTFLLAGSDVLSPVSTTGNEAGATSEGSAATPTTAPTGPGRADVIMLVHVDADRTKASVVSLPRDSLVTIPAYTDAAGVAHPASTRKINAAFSLGGGALLVRTVEGLTGLRVDHFAYVDYDGLIRLVDAVGGVTVNNPVAAYDVYGNPDWDFKAGEITLNGWMARVWVSQRKNQEGGDLGRASNSRELLMAIAAKLASPAVLSNPVRLDEVIGLATQVATVDETLDPGTMKGLALSMRGLDLSTIPMRTVPTTGKATVNGEVVYDLDPTRSRCLWTAVATSDLASVTRCSQA